MGQYGSVSVPSPRRRLWLRLPSPKLGRGVGGEGKINDFALTEPYWELGDWEIVKICPLSTIHYPLIKASRMTHQRIWGFWRTWDRA
jgi:hypothetical protein